ncbi:hypothetical protein GCM10017673_38860 [Streptosporangium violaceochromogenes]|nr:hypothetical protein GCM10017673_38860 [Streptosporangium violaceochromogenes]
MTTTEATMTAVTRVHAAAILLAPHGRTVLLLTQDGELLHTTPDDALRRTMYGGRVLLTKADLLDAGARIVPNSGGRLAPGSGPIVDAILDSLNAELRNTG